MAKIEKVIDEHTDLLMDIPEVTGVGQTEVEGRACIVVMLRQSLPEVEARIPVALGGYPVVVEVAGVIRTLGEHSTGQ